MNLFHSLTQSIDFSICPNLFPAKNSGTTQPGLFHWHYTSSIVDIFHNEDGDLHESFTSDTQRLHQVLAQ